MCSYTVTAQALRGLRLPLATLGNPLPHYVCKWVGLRRRLSCLPKNASHLWSAVNVRASKPSHGVVGFGGGPLVPLPLTIASGRVHGWLRLSFWMLPDSIATSGACHPSVFSGGLAHTWSRFILIRPRKRAAIPSSCYPLRQDHDHAEDATSPALLQPGKALPCRASPHSDPLFWARPPRASPTPCDPRSVA